MNTPLPVKGYTDQPNWKVELVNIMKQTEEADLRILDTLVGDKTIDQRWLAIGRSHLEQAFMAINRSIFQPTRVELDGGVD